MSHYTKPKWWTNKDEAQYEVAKMAAKDELEVYFDNESNSFKFYLKNKQRKKKRNKFIALLFKLYEK